MNNSKALAQGIAQPLASLISVLLLMYAPEEFRGQSTAVEALMAVVIMAIINGTAGYWATWWAPANTPAEPEHELEPPQ